MSYSPRLYYLACSCAPSSADEAATEPITLPIMKSWKKLIVSLLVQPIHERLHAVVRPLGCVIHPVWRVNGLLPPHLENNLRQHQDGTNENRPPPAGQEP